MRRVLSLLLACALLTAGCADFVHVDVTAGDLRPVDTPTQSYVYAADGSRIATLRLAFRENAAREDLPPVLVDAVVAAEDRRFYTHDGVDLRAVARAAVANRRAGRIVEGGSTITQQLVKNRYFPDAADTLERKVSEAHLAMELERSATKDEILVDYLNTVYFGAGAYGITAASRTYFRVEPIELTLHQAALLAGLIRSPESASPYRHAREARRLRRRVLDAMVATAAIDAPAARRAARRPLGVHPRPDAPATRFPYFVEYVKRTLLADPAFGHNEAARVRRLFGGGLHVHTTIEPELQARAEEAATAYWSGPDDPEVALAVIRPSDGQLVAAVGGRDFTRRQFDLATQGRRQPGSTFKTFALAAALRQGWRLDSLIDSGPGTFDVGGTPWSVRSATAGPMTLEEATAVSSNGAFARLALSVGGTRIADQARSMGVTSDTGTNPAIVLGGLRDGVSPLELASAYATLANAGVHIPVTAVTSVTDGDGDVVWRPDARPAVAMDGQTAWLVTRALRGVIDEGTGQLARLTRPAAGKTGTVQDHRDAWFVGYTADLSTAVWIGYPEAARPLVAVHGVGEVTGGAWPARIWQRFMHEAHKGLPARPFPYPEHMETTARIDPVARCLATPFTDRVKVVRGLPGVLPTQPCAPAPAPAPAPAQTSEPATGRDGATPSAPAPDPTGEPRFEPDPGTSTGTDIRTPGLVLPNDGASPAPERPSSPREGG